MDDLPYEQKLNNMKNLARAIIWSAIGEWRRRNSIIIEQECGEPNDYDDLDDYYEQVADLMTKEYEYLDDVFNFDMKKPIDYYDPIERYLKVKGIDYENIFDKEVMLEEMGDSIRFEDIDENSEFDEIVRAYVCYVVDFNKDCFDWYDFEYFAIE